VKDSFDVEATREELFYKVKEVSVHLIGPFQNHGVVLSPDDLENYRNAVEFNLLEESKRLERSRVVMKKAIKFLELYCVEPK
jgi:hypothetical protein